MTYEDIRQECGKKVMNAQSAYRTDVITREEMHNRMGEAYYKAYTQHTDLRDMEG